MANLAASLTVMLALALDWAEVGVRLLFGLILNLSVYLTNDMYDLDSDLASPSTDHAKAQFLASHSRAARLAQGGLLVLLLGIGAWWSRGLLVTGVLGVTLCWAYSAVLKRVPLVDVTVIGIGGAVSAMVAFPLDSALGWCLAGLLGLYSAVFQTIQIIRDHKADAKIGHQTTAVVLGSRRTVWLQRALLALSAAYAVLVLHRWVGLVLLLGALLPFATEQAARHWNRVRLVLGIGWLALVAWIAWHGASDGFLLSVDRSRLLAPLALVR